MDKGKIIKGAFILTGANVITRILGFFYRVYMAELIGAEGMGLYQLIVPVYMLIWSATSSGFSTAISKLAASEKAEGRSPFIILGISAAMSVGLGVILGVLVYINADFIGSVILGDERTALSLRILSFCFPFMALGSCVRGYFFGMQNSLPPAVSQVAEQCARMAVIFVAGSALIPKGIEYACAAAVMGMCVGELVSCVYITISFLTGGFGRFSNSRSIRSACGLILAMVIPLTLNRLISSLLQAAENVLIPSRLTLWGLSRTDAVSEFGRLSGMAMPLIMFPSSFLTAVSITIVPAISESSAKHSSREVKATIEKTILFATVTGFGAAGLFLTLPERISSLIYGQNSIGDLLFMLGFLSPCMYLNVMLCGILNGLGEQLAIFINGLCGSLICLAFVWFAIPEFGICGYIFGSLAASAVTSGLNIHRVAQQVDFSLNLSETIMKPFLCAALTAFVVLALNRRLPPLGSFEFVGTICLCAVFAVLFLLLLMVCGCVKKSDIEILFAQFKR